MSGRSRGRTLSGAPLEPGVNVDLVDIQAGMNELVACGYPATEQERHMVIQYALQRHARGEEAQAQRGAIDQNFHGITLTCWIRILAVARASAEDKASKAKKAEDKVARAEAQLAKAKAEAQAVAAADRPQRKQK